MSEARSVQAPAPIKTLVDSDGNEFHVMEKLGEGGQGIVYTTDDPTLAIKQPIMGIQRLDEAPLRVLWIDTEQSADTI